MRALAFFLAVPLAAEFLTIEQRFGGIECASCSGSLERSFGRMRGVRAVTVDTSKGVVRLELAEGNTVRLEAVRDQLKGVGFTPGAADVKLAGTIVRRDRKWHIEAFPSGTIYALDPEKAGLVEGKRAVVSGVIAAERPGTIAVREITP